MYGTVMIGRSDASIDVLRNLVEEWVAAIGSSSGFVDERVLAGADGQIVVCVRFRDKAAYAALADNPAQATWWSEVMAPLIQGEPAWIDGEWHDM